MNVLVLLSDEHHPDALGCAGHPLAKTPHLDRLAARGTRFTSAVTPSPICVPARASLATGRAVHEIGYWDNAHAYDGRVPGWGRRLQATGIRVESIGKLHYRNATDPTGFDVQHEPMHIHQGSGQVWGSVRDPMPETVGASTLFNELGAGESEYNRYDLRSTERACAWLRERAREPAERPWVLFVGLVAPHFPFVVPQRYLDLYPLESIALLQVAPSRHPWVEAQARHCDHDAALGTDARRRLAIASYLGLVSFMDEQVGRILDALEATGLARTTQIVYTSDHGDNLGARAMWNKCLLYRDSTGIPMIAAGAGFPAGHACRTSVSLTDLYRTILYGVRLPLTTEEGEMPTRSLQGVANEADDPARPAFSEYHAVGSPSAAYMLRIGRFKYHHYVGYPPELFDLADDPHETRDLAPLPQARPMVAAMERALRAIVDPEKVDRQAKDTQNALVARVGGRERALGLGPRGATPVR